MLYVLFVIDTDCVLSLNIASSLTSSDRQCKVYHLTHIEEKAFRVSLLCDALEYKYILIMMSIIHVDEIKGTTVHHIWGCQSFNEPFIIVNVILNVFVNTSIDPFIISIIINSMT